MNFLSASLRLCGLLLALAITSAAQIPAPKDTLGFTPGDDRKLASWASIVDYFKKLDAASDRVMFEEIGKTTMGAPFVYATISSPENLKSLEKYKKINAQLADPRTFKSNDVAAKKLIAQGKTIVLITCGIHSTEVGSTLSSMLIAHRLAMVDNPDVKKILDNTIILLVPSLNPDGVDIVKNWYDKTLGTPYEGTEPPELYHKYVGHDNNRDWYAFTQVETQLTVDKIHNVWHPQIVHDIHQQGQNGSRLFLPPYMLPVEPNVPKQIIEGYTELGNFMAKSLRGLGYQGITTDSTYDAWTPARAYSHYHGGVRILSETASAKLATPIAVKFEDLRAGGGLDPKKESPNFGPVWKGGEWKLQNITDYMTTAAFALMNHAADNRERWLSKFYEIGKEAVKSNAGDQSTAYILEHPPMPPQNSTDADQIMQADKARARFYHVVEVLQAGGVEIFEIAPSLARRERVPPGSKLIPLAQPYGGFARALLEPRFYPDLRNEDGTPLPPYDVTAHSLALLTGINVRKSDRPIAGLTPRKYAGLPRGFGGGTDLGRGFAIYRSHSPNMDEGWTRFVAEVGSGSQLKDTWVHTFNYESVGNEAIQDNRLQFRSIIFPDQSPNQIFNGYAKGSMPDEYTGGIGTEGVENLRKFVENGGTLVFLNRAANFAIEHFNLPVKDVTRGLNRKDFFIPGSLLRTELDTTHPIAKGMPQQSIAWFENSPAFEIQTDPLALTKNFRIIASYPKDPKQILLSGWALGAEKIAGKAALVEFTIGKGKIVLFGFRPQYRGQSLATFPLLFNAIRSKDF